MTNTSHTAGMSWQLRPLLERHSLSAYQLAQTLKGKMSAGSVYTLARGDTERVSLATLGHVLGALEQLTGTRYTAADLLAYEPPQPIQVPPNELEEWQTADLMPPLEPYDWGAGGEPVGEPVRYVPGVGFVAGQE